ncbi:MAG: ABC transporter permease [Acidobacteria bacterium]|nr:ABC transporter permease [Acidobacteriota bacterium]
MGLWSSRSGTGFGPISYPNYKDYRDQNHVFTGLAASSVARPMNLSGRDTPTQVNGMPVSGDYFSVLGVRPVLGRGFLPEEDRTPGTHPVVVISHGLWQGRFGSDPNVVGDIVVLNDQPFTVVGVAPKGFPGASVGPGIFIQADVWYPLMWDFHDRWGAERGLGVLGLVGRLKPGISLDQAQADMSILADQIERAYPGISMVRAVSGSRSSPSFGEDR